MSGSLPPLIRHSDTLDHCSACSSPQNVGIKHKRHNIAPIHTIYTICTIIRKILSLVTKLPVESIVGNFGEIPGSNDNTLQNKAQTGLFTLIFHNSPLSHWFYLYLPQSTCFLQIPLVYFYRNSDTKIWGLFVLLRGKLDSWFYYLNRQQTQVINVNVKYNVQTIITYIQCKIVNKSMLPYILSLFTMSSVTQCL